MHELQIRVTFRFEDEPEQKEERADLEEVLPGSNLIPACDLDQLKREFLVQAGEVLTVRREQALQAAHPQQYLVNRRAYLAGNVPDLHPQRRCLEDDRFRIRAEHRLVGVRRLDKED